MKAEHKKVLANGGMRRMLLSTLVSAAGDAFLLVALPFAVLGVSDQPSAFGAVLAAHTVALVIFMLPGGLVGDRFSPTKTIFVTDIVRLVTQGVIALLVLTGTATIWLMAAVYSVHGIASAFHFPTSRAVISQLVPPEGIQSATALLSMAYSTALILGPLAAGLTLSVSSPGVAVAVDAGTFLVSAVLIAGLGVGKPPQSDADASNSWKEVFGGFTQVRARRWLALGLFHAALFQCFAVAPNQVLGPLIANSDYRGAGDWALLVSVASIGHLVGGLLAMRIIPRRPMRAVFLSAAGGAPVLIALGMAPALAIPLVLMGVYGIAISYADTLWHSVIQRWLPGSVLGRVFAIDGLISFGLRPVAIVAVAAAGSLWGSRDVMIVGGIATLVLSALVLLLPASRMSDDTEEPRSKSVIEVEERM